MWFAIATSSWITLYLFVLSALCGILSAQWGENIVSSLFTLLQLLWFVIFPLILAQTVIICYHNNLPTIR